MQRTANIVGLITIIFWATSSFAIANVGHIPPFQLCFLTMGLGFIFTAFYWRTKNKSIHAILRQPLPTHLFGLIGVGGYMTLIYAAYHSAPAIEVNLLNYLWPMLLVLFSAMAGRGALKIHHIIGLIAGFFGAFLIFSGDSGFAFSPQNMIGYIFATSAAVIWAWYSTLSYRYFSSSDTVGVFFLTTALLTGIIHVLTENFIVPTFVDWMIIGYIGLTRISFLMWDYALRYGDLKLVASASYFIPLFSTALMIAAGLSPMHFALWWAAGLICLGCLVTNIDKIRQSFAPRNPAMDGAEK